MKAIIKNIFIQRIENSFDFLLTENKGTKTEKIKVLDKRALEKYINSAF